VVNARVAHAATGSGSGDELFQLRWNKLKHQEDDAPGKKMSA
jgi:hypothetical protein